MLSLRRLTGRRKQGEKEATRSDLKTIATYDHGKHFLF